MCGPYQALELSRDWKKTETNAVLAAILNQSGPFVSREALDPIEKVLGKQRVFAHARIELECERLSLGWADEYRIECEPDFVHRFSHHRQLSREQHQLRPEEGSSGPQSEETQIVDPALSQRGYVVRQNAETGQVLLIGDSIDKILCREVQPQLIAQLSKGAVDLVRIGKKRRTWQRGKGLPRILQQQLEI